MSTHEKKIIETLICDFEQAKAEADTYSSQRYYDGVVSGLNTALKVMREGEEGK